MAQVSRHVLALRGHSYLEELHRTHGVASAAERVRTRKMATGAPAQVRTATRLSSPSTPVEYARL